VQEIRQEMAPKAPEEAKPSVREAPAAKEPSPELQAKIDLLGKALTRIMSRYGLKDVALKLVADMKAEGEYSSRVLSLALDATDPVSALRHESIHAMKELGFFSDQQWKSLERQAKEKWIDQYLKQKNVNREPLKEGQTSRYDAYMKLYGGDEEAVIEEAIADAFADFDATKAPPGMLQALLKKIRNFFQAIKEAFGAEPDAERIFRKAERGELRGREVAPNVWKETTEEKEQAEAYEDQNGILPYTSAGQIDVSVETPKASIKAPYKERELAKGKENHPILGVPLNANGTVTLYFPTNNASAREVAKTKRLKAVNPTANRIYLTNESSPAAVRGRLGNIDQGPVEANVMVHVPPELLQLDMEHEDGRKDFFIQLAEGNAFAEKMKLTKLFTLYKPRSEAISKTTTLSDIGKGLESGIAAYRKMSPDKRKARLAQARQVLKDEHNVGTLLGENGKLQKTRLNEYQLPEDIKNSVASLGLGLASAQKINERNLSTCPNSARCEGLCLGETSGQNQLYGGDGPFRAGPRLSQYLKTEALVMHPEDFGIVLYEEIKRFEAWSRSQKGFEYITNDAGEKIRVKKQVYTPAIRLNVTSDFPPKMWKPLIEGFPRVRFYDYTKLATPGPIANNHHLTYSSDGVAQVVEGKTVGLGSNWDAMIKRLNGGFNVAMAFTSKRDMPNFVQDEKTGDRFQVWNGDNYDARFLDPRPGQKENLFKKGMIIGLTNKDRTGRPEDAAIRHDGFFVDYDRERDGDTVTIRDQEKIKQGKKVIPIAKPRFSLRDKLGMYSELENKIEAGSNKAPAASWKAYINGLTQKGVKPEEIEWSGVKDWLDLQKGTVTKEELLNYLKQGGVQVEETVLGGKSQRLRWSEWSEPDESGDARSTAGNYTIVRADDGKFDVYEESAGTLDEALDSESAARQVAELHAGNSSAEQQTKYSRYALPGGENYREVLLTLPSDVDAKTQRLLNEERYLVLSPEDRAKVDAAKKKAGVQYRSTHWDQPNVLAHIRLNDRTDADGNKVLFVEEIQSDWGQEGKKKGFKGAPLTDSEKKRLAELTAQVDDASGMAADLTPAERAEFGALTRRSDSGTGVIGVPSAPFVTKTEGWLNLALKRIMVMAAEGGYDKVAFVNGKQSAERYDLSKQVDDLRYGDGILVALKDGKIVLSKETTPEELPDLVGKEVADRLLKAPEMEGNGYRRLSGLDLKVGGEGMKTFYDTIVPTAVKKLLPKVGGGQMEMVDVQVPPASAMYPDKTTLRETIQQSGFDVTPAMRNKVQTTGLPRFSLRDTVNVDGTERPATSSTNKPIYPTEEGTKNFWRWFKDSAVVDDEGRPLVVYRGVDTDYGTTARVSKEGALGAGIYTTPSASFASSYAEGEAPNVMPLYVSLQKPLLLKHKGNEDPMIMALVQLGMKQDKAEAMVEKAYEEKGYIGKQVMNRALSQGYDGLMQYRDGKLTEIVAFNPTQIKSAIGNVGKFDPVEPSIKASLRDATDPVTRARIDQITTPREEKSFIKRITEAIAPKSASSFRAAFLDRYNRLSEYDKELVLLMGGAPLLADASSHSAALMSDMSAGVLAGAMGVHDGVGGIPVYVNGHTKIVNNNNTVKGPIAIFAPLAKYNDPFIYQKYQFWAAVNRGLRLYAQGRDPKMITPADQAEAAKILVDHPEFADIQKEWIKFNDGLVQYLKDTGVLTEAAAKEFVKYADYIPFYRQADGEETVGPQIFASLSGVRAPKKLKGSEAPLGEFLETVVRNVQYSIEAGMKNVAAQRAVNTAVAIGQANRLNYVSSAPNVVKVLENGKTSYYETKDMLFVEAMKSLNLGDLPFIGLLAGPANLLRNLVTKDPAFMLANMMRDSMSAWVSSGVKMTPMVDTLTNFTKALRGQNPEYEALLNSGVIGGYDYSQGVEISARLFDRALRKKAGVYTPAEQLARPFVSLWDALEKGTTASDAATRMEIYKKTLAATGNEAEALFRAVEVMNFNRKGNNPMVRVLTAAVPFLNARMQGLDVLYRAAFGRGTEANAKEIQKSFFIRGMTIAALSTMYWMLASEDDEWKRQEQETRDNYWILGDVKIPIPFEIGVLFKVIPERILEYSFGDDTGKDFLKSMTRQLTSTLSFNPIPQTALPLIESVTNYSFFTGRPIVSQGLEDVNPAYQIAPGTSRVGELIGGATKDLPTALQISPVKIDEMIRGYTGTLGGYMMDLFDAIYDLNTDAPKAAKRFEQMPVIRRFAVDPLARGQVTAYYELKNSVDEAVRTANLLERNMKPQEWGEFMQENMGLLGTKDYVLDLEKSMKQYREMKNFVRASTMDAGEKKDITTNITELENNLASNIQEIKKMIDAQ
jgi:Holliday junction resolvasome RuvABC DNA-binding subunit